MILFNKIKSLTTSQKTLITMLLVLLLSVGTCNKAQSQEQTYLFYGQGCPHCQNVEEYIQNNNISEIIELDKKEIYFNRENAVLYNTILDKYNIPTNKRGVPALVINDKVFIGDTPIINYLKSIQEEPAVKTQSGITTPTKEPEKPKQDLTILAVVLASLVDAINPCAFAVLILLMTTVLLSGDKKKALFSGLSFAAAIFISYFLMGLGLYKTIQATNLSKIFFNLIGWLAIILGLLNIKDAIWYGKGFLMEVPLSWRPKLKKVISSATSPTGAFVIGFVVSLFLLPCTSGPYIVILGMLAQKVTQTQAVLYLLTYNLVFVMPMILITLGVYKGLDIKKAEKVRSKHLRTLHFIAGTILIIMGLFVLGGFV